MKLYKSNDDELGISFPTHMENKNVFLLNLFIVIKMPNKTNCKVTLTFLNDSPPPLLIIILLDENFTKQFVKMLCFQLCGALLERVFLIKLNLIFLFVQLNSNKSFNY